MAAETTSAPMAGNATEEKVAQCMRMLAGQTDEHKFAGLLMVTKLGDLPAEQLQQVRRQVLATISVNFFLRLLHTKSPDDVETLSSFQSLGLNLIARRERCGGVRARQAREVPSRAAGLAVNAIESSQDCVRIISGLEQTEKGLQVMMHESVLGRLFSAMKKLSRSHSNRELIVENKSVEQEQQTDELLEDL